MYWIKSKLYNLLIIGALALSPFFIPSLEASYEPTGKEVAGVSVRFGGGYGYHRPYHRNRRYYRHHGPRYYRHRSYRPYYRSHRPYYRYHYYQDPYYYYYGKPGGVYFNWRR